MANCVIRPIPLVEMKSDKSLMTYRLNFCQVIKLVTYVWYIEGAKEKILVDAGASARYFSEVRAAPAKTIQTLDAGLSKLGLGFDDIDLVILTHLHHDHVTEASRFTRAKFLVQQTELDFAQKPHPAVAESYNRDFIQGLDFEVISGDAKVGEGVSVLSTPGHTPGGQSVSVDTAQGTAIITGICSILENYYPPPPLGDTMPVITPGIHTNVLDVYDSVVRIKEMADIIVPAHEPSFRKKSCIP